MMSNHLHGSGDGVAALQVQVRNISLVRVLLHRVCEAGAVRGGPRAGELSDCRADSCTRRGRRRIHVTLVSLQLSEKLSIPFCKPLAAIHFDKI